MTDDRLQTLETRLAAISERIEQVLDGNRLLAQLFETSGTQVNEQLRLAQQTRQRDQRQREAFYKDMHDLQLKTFSSLELTRKLVEQAGQRMTDHDGRLGRVEGRSSWAASLAMLALVVGLGGWRR